MPHIAIAAEKLLSIFGFPITNTLVTSWVAVGTLILLATLISRRIAVIPGTVQNIFEFFTESFLDLMEGMFGSRGNAERYFPLVATIFLFVITSNWLGIVPGVGSIGFFEHAMKEGSGVGVRFVPLFRSAASDLNVTLALGIVTILLVNVAGAQAIGIRGHLGKYFSFKNPISAFVGLLEFISEFAKIISFSFRLFGNVFAGEVLLVIVGLLVPYGAPVPFLLLEVFVGFIQALVFAMLTMVFISIAVAHH